jgi:DNA polymerase-3 subunit alpha
MTSSATAAADGQPALAITDLNNLFGAIKFYKAARGKGVKPLIGAEIVMEGLGKDPGVLSRMILLVQGSQGYLNLSELLARAWTRNVVKAQAVVKLEWLKELSEGLILLSGAQAGPVGQALVQGDAASGHGPGAATGLDLSAPVLPGAAARRSPRRRGTGGRRRCNSRLG